LAGGSERAAPGGVPGARGRNQHFLRFSKAGTRKIQCFRPSGAQKNNAFEAIKHCKLQCFVASEATKHCNLQCFVASKTNFACFGGSRGPPAALGPPGALQGASGAPSGRFSGASWGSPGGSWGAPGGSWGAPGGSWGAPGGPWGAPEGSKLILGGTKRHPRRPHEQ
jgi:hypothetical protein